MTDVRVRPVFEGARVVVLVLESVTIAPAASRRLGHLFARLEPEAVVVSREGELELFDLDGNTISIDALDDRCAGVREKIHAALA